MKEKNVINLIGLSPLNWNNLEKEINYWKLQCEIRKYIFSWSFNR